MKIAWFGHVASARRNGKVSYTRTILDQLSRRGFPVVFFFNAAREFDLVTPPHTRGIRTDALDMWNRGTLSLPGTLRSITRVLDEEQPNLAHVSLSFSNLDSAIARLCHAKGIPIVGTWHMPFGPPVSWWGILMDLGYRASVKTLNQYDAVICSSPQMRNRLSKYGVSEHRLHMIPNGVDVEWFSPGPSTYKHDLGARLVISYVGRVDPEKNVDRLCKAFLAFDLPVDHKLVIVGGGASLYHLQETFKDPRILFRGHITDPAELRSVLRASDISVLPSSVEGLAIGMLEGMASGAAMIVTDVGGDGDAVRDAGIVLDLHELPEQLPLALRQLVDAPDLRRELGERARRRAVERYSLQANMDKLVTLYQELQVGRSP